MKHKREATGRGGFVMLEVMIVIMAFMIVSSSLLAVSAQARKRAARRAAETEAYYAAVTAVRMMAGEIMENEDPPGPVAMALETPPGLSVTAETLTVKVTGETAKEMPETFTIPVRVASEVSEDGNLLTLCAEAEVAGERQLVSLSLEKQEGEWKLLGYGFEAAGKGWDS